MEAELSNDFSWEQINKACQFSWWRYCTCGTQMTLQMEKTSWTTNCPVVVCFFFFALEQSGHTLPYGRNLLVLGFHGRRRRRYCSSDAMMVRYLWSESRPLLVLYVGIYLSVWCAPMLLPRSQAGGEKSCLVEWNENRLSINHFSTAVLWPHRRMLIEASIGAPVLAVLVVTAVVVFVW